MSFVSHLSSRVTLPWRAFFFACLAALAVTNSARASSITLDPDGTAAANGASTVNTFDFRPGNTLYQGIGTLLVDKTGQEIQHYVHSRISALYDENNDPIVINGLDTNFELTMVMGFTATADVAGVNTSYERAAVTTVNFFKLIYDNSPDANDLAGTGFDDGLVIVDGSILTASGGFSRFSAASPPPPGPITNLDAFGTDNYPTIDTRRVTGGAEYEIQVTYSDSDFFFNSLPAFFSFILYNTSEITPFTTVDPSALFSDGSNPTIAPNLGSVNGENDDFQTQADASGSFNVVIPEPSSIMLCAVGAVALAVQRRGAQRRLRAAKSAA